MNTSDLYCKNIDNNIPMNVVITPEFVLDCYGNKVTRQNTFELPVLNLSGELVDFSFLLGCPVVSEDNIANRGTKYECIKTCNVTSVANLTINEDLPLPEFKAVAYGKKGIPVNHIKRNHVDYIDMITEILGEYNPDTFEENLISAGYLYLPRQFSMTFGGVTRLIVEDKGNINNAYVIELL